MGFYDVYVACLSGLRSIVARNNEPQAHKQPLLDYGSVLCTPPPPPPLVTFDEIPKYRGIDNLKTTLHLIINKFIENQHKVVLNLNFITNHLPSKLFDFETNQQKILLNCDLITNSLTTNQQKTALHRDFITDLGRFLTNKFITKQQTITNQQTGAQSLERGCHQNKEIVQ